MKLIKNKKLIIGSVIIMLWIIAVIYNSEHKKTLLKNGIETIGVVEEVLVNKGHKPDGLIRFRFVDLECMCVLRSSSSCSNSQSYEAIIGGMYRVRYIVGKSEKTATIYIEEPVYDTIYDSLLFCCPIRVSEKLLWCHTTASSTCSPTIWEAGINFKNDFAMKTITHPQTKPCCRLLLLFRPVRGRRVKEWRQTVSDQLRL